MPIPAWIICIPIIEIMYDDFLSAYFLNEGSDTGDIGIVVWFQDT